MSNTAPYGFLTFTGRSKEAAALANGTALTLAELAWGDSDRIPNGGETELENETGRMDLMASGIQGDAPNIAFFRTEFLSEDGPYIIREAGLIDTDGDMIAIFHFPLAVNKIVGETLTFNALLAFSDLENLAIRIDSPSSFIPAERRVNTEEGIKGGGDLGLDRTISLDIDGLTELPASSVHYGDTLALHDASANRSRKVTVGELATVMAQSAPVKALVTRRARDFFMGQA